MKTLIFDHQIYATQTKYKGLSVWNTRELAHTYQNASVCPSGRNQNLCSKAEDLKSDFSVFNTQCGFRLHLVFAMHKNRNKTHEFCNQGNYFL